MTREDAIIKLETLDAFNVAPTISEALAVAIDAMQNCERREPLKNILYEAGQRLEEEAKNGTASDINYWRGYRDAVKRMMENE